MMVSTLFLGGEDMDDTLPLPVSLFLSSCAVRLLAVTFVLFALEFGCRCAEFWSTWENDST